MRKRIFKWLAATVAIFCIITFYLVFTSQKPPVKELKEARLSLTKAEKIHASLYATTLFSDAMANYDLAMRKWRIENKKIFFKRNYKDVMANAVSANKLALVSIKKAKAAKLGIKDFLADQIKAIEKEVDLYNKFLKKVPLNKAQRNELTRGNILFKEGIIAFRNDNYQTALHKLDSAERLISRISEYSKDVLKMYLENFSDWKRLANRSIENSRKQNTSCIIVDKLARRCTLYKNGNLHSEYNIELGPNWIGEKNYSGDKSTPEGAYNVVDRKSNGESIYYKALLLNYPNESDIRRFNINKRRGLLERNAKIGSLIEIHGDGGKGTDWTNGCISLRDSDMEKLFPHCPLGTEVIIIGSLAPYQDILKTE